MQDPGVTINNPMSVKTERIGDMYYEGIIINRRHVVERLEERSTSLVGVEGEVKKIISVLREKNRRGLLVGDWAVHSKSFIAVGNGVRWNTVLKPEGQTSNRMYVNHWRV